MLPEDRAALGSTPQVISVEKGGSVSKDEVGETGKDELRDEEEDGDEGSEEEGEVSMGVGPLE